MNLFKSMETFVSVIDQGGFASAARVRGQSKAQVSRTISGLEDHLGIRLMQRSTRRHVLTEEGERYLRHAREILDENARVEEMLSERRVAPRGRLRVNGPLSWGERNLGTILPGFVERYRDVEVDITLTDRFVDLLEEGFDMAIRIGGNRESSLVGRKLGEIRQGLFAAPSYLKATSAPRTPEDLKDHKCLAYTSSGEVRPWLVGGQRIIPKPAMVANNGDILRCAAVAGGGLTMLPDFIVEEDLKAGRLVEITSADCQSKDDLKVPVLAVYPERRHLSVKVRVFVDYLVEVLND
jgi:DNA-binding transcriptional LysR family regulator